MRPLYFYTSLVLVLARAVGTQAESPETTKKQHPPAPHAATEIMTNVFHTYCLDCHGKWKQEAGLDLRTRQSMLIGGESGPALPALVPDNPEKSLVYQRLAANEMPPRKNLYRDDQYAYRPRADDIDRLREWIAAGAPPAPSPSVGNRAATGAAADEDDQDFWAFQVPRRPAVPEVRQSGSMRTPIDAFLLSRLEANGIGYAPEADRLLLLRRAYFDLIGLPPRPDEVDAYLADERPGATNTAGTCGVIEITSFGRSMQISRMINS